MFNEVDSSEQYYNIFMPFSCSRAGWLGGRVARVVYRMSRIRQTKCTQKPKCWEFESPSHSEWHFTKERGKNHRTKNCRAFRDLQFNAVSNGAGLNVWVRQWMGLALDGNRNALMSTPLNDHYGRSSRESLYVTYNAVRRFHASMNATQKPIFPTKPLKAWPI